MSIQAKRRYASFHHPDTVRCELVESYYYTLVLRNVIKLHRVFLRSFLFIVLLSTLTTTSLGEEKRFGYRPVEPSQFDQFPKVPRYRAFLPVSIDLSKHFPTPGMQDAESCTGWAVGYAARSYYAATAEKRNVGRWQNVPSPSYIYNSIREPDNCASGAEIPAALGLLMNGSLSVEQFDKSCKIPSAAERAQATDFKITKWLAVDPRQVDDVKGQLARGNPVVFGMFVGESFEGFRGKGVYKGEADAGFGHAMTVVGYDDKRQAFKIINSWGTLWGDKGFGWIDYDFFKKAAREAYIMEVDGEPTALPKVPAVVVAPKPSVKPVTIAPVEPTVAVPSDEIERAKKERNEPSGSKETPIERPVTSNDCSLVVSDNIGGRKRLKGFVGSKEALQSLREEWSGYADDFEIEVRPWPQCEVLLTLASVIGADDSPRLSTIDKKDRFIEGDEIAFEFVAPASPSYVYVVYIQADGSVVALMQPGSVLAPSQTGEAFVFGDGRNNSPRFTAGRPFGTEMVLALASASPLFEGALPHLQTDREFLSALRRAVIYKSDQALGDRRISAAFLGIETEERK